MTPDQAIAEARSFVGDTGPQYPVTDSMLYARINANQRHWFAKAASWNREYFGETVDADMDEDGCLDLSNLEGTDLYPIESVDQVEVLRSGTTDYPPGTKVTICRADERLMHDAPRCTIRSHTLAGVTYHERTAGGGSKEVRDLSGVEAIRIWYSRRPRSIDGRGWTIIGRDDKDDSLVWAEQDLEIGDPWDWLIVWDLVATLIGRTATVDGNMKSPVLAMAEQAAAELEAIFEQHVRGYTYGREQITE